MIKKATGEMPLSQSEDLYFDAYIELNCPICKDPNTIDFNKQGIYHPAPESENTMSFTCACCDSEFELPITLKSVIVSVHYDIRDLRKIKSKDDE